MGLDQIFTDLYKGEMKPDHETAAEIVKRLGKQNYITPSVRHLHQEAMSKEYGKFFEQNINSSALQRDKVGRTAPERKGFWKRLLRKVQWEMVAFTNILCASGPRLQHTR